MKSRLVLSIAWLSLSLTAAQAANGPGALWVAGASTTPTHWNIPATGTTCAEIRGVEAPLSATLTVWIKSTEMGNAQLLATRIGLTNNYAFCYTPPVWDGGVIGACSTTIVSYGTIGHNTSNDLIDDGILNGSAHAACGLRFIDAVGRPIECTPLPVVSPNWGRVKTLYR